MTLSPLSQAIVQEGKEYRKGWKERARRDRLKFLAQTGRFPTQQAIADAMGLTQGRVAQLKKSAIRAGLFTETQWRGWLKRNRAAAENHTHEKEI